MNLIKNSSSTSAMTITSVFTYQPYCLSRWRSFLHACGRSERHRHGFSEPARSGGTANGGVGTSAVQLSLSQSWAPRCRTVVTSDADSGPGSLRQILSIAALKAGDDLITFSSELSGQTIKLVSPLTINEDDYGVTIDASPLPAG